MGAADLTPKAGAIIEEAQVLVGGKRHLEYFPQQTAVKMAWEKDLKATLQKIKEWAQTRSVVVLASGDANFYGIGPRLVETLGPENIVFHPNITAVQAAASLLKTAWNDAKVISLHGRDWQALEEVVGKAVKIFLYTDPEHGPAQIGRWLMEKGRGDTRMCVLEDLGQESQRYAWLSPEEAAAGSFSPLNMVVILDDPLTREKPELHLGMPETAFSHEASLITKAEVRAVVLAKLALAPGQVLWDVGAGCGSVSLEASLLMPGGRILAVEQVPERVEQIKANSQKFGVENLRVIQGQAPESLVGLPAPDRVFIGGGGPRLASILETVLPVLKPGGKVVLTATLLDSLQTARQALNRSGFEVEICHLQVSRSRSLGDSDYMQALNPVWIIRARQTGSFPSF
jgi:precorrin-6Y C5,15-methyltransferase (decarboxylating)